MGTPDQGNEQHRRPKTGQESVWDYPRPPRVEPAGRRIRVEFGGVMLVDTRRALRVLETSHPPVYYIPREDVRREHIVPAAGRTFCEFKGAASYWSVRVGDRVAERAAWSYEQPSPRYEVLKGHLAFYAMLMDGCFVDDERVEPQAGSFYGGWITSDIVGPFKGARGTEGW